MAFSRPRTPQPLQGTSNGLRTPPDQEMTDQASQVHPSPRPSLPSSTADFALSAQPSASAPTSPSTSFMALDDPMSTSPYASPVSTAWSHAYNHQSTVSGQMPSAAHPLMRKLRRPSLLGVGISGLASAMGVGAGSRMNSPLASSFTSPFAFELPSRLSSTIRQRQAQVEEEEEEYASVLLSYEPRDPTPQEQDRDAGPSSSSSSSKKMRQRVSRSMSPSTPPPRRLELESSDDPAEKRISTRRLRAPLLRRSSSSNSISEAAPSASTSKTVPIPTGSGLQQQRSRPAIPRLRNIITESNPADVELKSEAKFQRFVASHADIPAPFRSYPRTPRSRAGSSNASMMGGGTTPGAVGKAMVWPNDRGRFPEEACVDDEELDEDDTGSSDGLEQGADDSVGPGGAPMSLTEEGSLSNIMGGGLGIHRGSSGSLGGMLESPAGMDLDVTMSGSWISGSPPVSTNGGSGMNTSSSTPNQWRHTPPPTATGNGGRVGKRKFDDRYDPYPSAKRRAVSPAINISPYHSHPSLASPITLPRSPITIPRPLPASATSSPVLRPVVRLSSHYAHGGNGHAPTLSGSGNNGPTLGMGLMGMGVGMGTSWGTSSSTAASKAEEKEVAGTGDRVGSLRL